MGIEHDGLAEAEVPGDVSGQLGFAGARLAGDEQGFAECEGHVHGGHQALGWDVGFGGVGAVVGGALQRRGGFGDVFRVAVERHD